MKTTTLPYDEFPFIIDKSGLEGKYILTRYACAKLLLTIQGEGLLTKANASHSIEAIKNTLNFIEKYKLLFLEMLNMLEKNEYITVAGENIVTTEKVTNVAQILEDILEEIAKQNKNDDEQEYFHFPH